MENQTNSISPEQSAELAEKKRFRRHTEWLGWGIVSYEAILLVISTIVVIFYIIYGLVIATIKGESFDFDQYSEHLMNTDGGMIAAVIVGSIFMGFFMMKRVAVKEIFAKKKKMTLPVFIVLLFLFMLIQYPIGILIDVFESLLNHIGLTAETAIENAAADSSTLTAFLYVSFGAPIFEEIIFRGFTMNAYHKANGSKTLALVMSAIIFGMMHGNPVQIVFAFIVGLVLGYTAMEYGIIWSILLHIINNFVLGDLLNFVTKPLPEEIQNRIGSAVMLFFFIGGVIVLLMKRKFIMNYIRENRCESKYFKWSLCSIPLLIFAIINIALAAMQITPIE